MGKKRDAPASGPEACVFKVMSKFREFCSTGHRQHIELQPTRGQSLQCPDEIERSSQGTHLSIDPKGWKIRWKWRCIPATRRF
jgi:hypothetical protein